MNENIKNLAEQAGFALKGNEEWNPGDVVDWSSRYNKELVKYTHLLVQEVLELHISGTDVLSYFGITETDGKVSIDIEFNDEEMLQYMQLAHERNITFNKFVELTLQKAIRDHNTDILE